MLYHAQHRPMFCVQVITQVIRLANATKLPVSQELMFSIDHNISQLASDVSTCERILNTPIPLSYTRHTGRILMFWMMILPWSMWSYCGWAMVVVMGLIAFVLLGIEEIGVYIEEPFSLLPLEALTDRLAQGLRMMANDSQKIQGYFSETFQEEKEEEEMLWAAEGSHGNWNGGPSGQAAQVFDTAG